MFPKAELTTLPSTTRPREKRQNPERNYPECTSELCLDGVDGLGEVDVLLGLLEGLAAGLECAETAADGAGLQVEEEAAAEAAGWVNGRKHFTGHGLPQSLSGTDTAAKWSGTITSQDPQAPLALPS